MKNNTIFTPTFDEYLMEKVYENIPNWSQHTFYSEFDSKSFLELIEKYFLLPNKIERTENFTSKKDKKIISLFKNHVLWNQDILISYNTANRHQDTEEVVEQEDMADSVQILTNVCNNVQIYYNELTKSKVDELALKLNDILYTDTETNNFYTIGMDSYGFKLMQQKSIIVESDVELHYGKEFAKQYPTIIDLLTNKTHGLFLCYGPPGGGKTSLIRQLISVLSDKKKIIYMPAYMIEQLANPEFITFLQDHKNSILILEDAEFALQSRNEEYGAQAVSNLLNITSGLLNDAIKIQVVATFNMDKRKLDEALLRPGRLLFEWEFNKLSLEDSIKLAKHLDKDLNITEPMTVAEIYEGKVQENKKKKRKIGFN